MIARIAYAFREMWASFRRNLTLTAAAILTSAIALLLVGTTLLIQRAFDNLLVQWRGDVEMIVFVRSDATPEQITLIGDTIKSAPTIIDVEKLQYLDKVQTYEEAKRIFAGDPVTLSLLTPETIPTQFKVVPVAQDPTLVRSLADQYRTLPGVEAVALAEDEFEVISTLSGFVRTVTLVMSLVLLAARGLYVPPISSRIFTRRRSLSTLASIVRRRVRRTSEASPSQVPCQSSPSTQLTPVTKRLDSIVRRTAPVSGSTFCAIRNSAVRMSPAPKYSTQRAGSPSRPARPASW